LTIGMPIYNGERFVAETLDSILAQDCDFELVISDNGSTDGTEAICQRYAATDARVKSHRYDSNRGAAWNYNNCFRLSQGRYFKWAAYDDLLAPGFCSKCLDILDADPEVVLAYARASVIDEAGRFVRDDSDRMNLTDESPPVRFAQYFAAYVGHNICNPVFGIFKSDVLKRTHLIGNFLSSDQILLGEIALHGKIREVPEGLFLFRWHPQNSMSAFNAAQRLLWFDPTRGGKLCLVHWQWVRNLSVAIDRAPMTAADKWRCRGKLYWWAIQNAEILSKEAIKGMFWPILKRTLYRERTTGL
jgi:glycosyltransferase involved in cell wall biosynthesis